MYSTSLLHVFISYPRGFPILYPPLCVLDIFILFDFSIVYLH